MNNAANNSIDNMAVIKIVTKQQASSRTASRKLSATIQEAEELQDRILKKIDEIENRRI